MRRVLTIIPVLNVSLRPGTFKKVSMLLSSGDPDMNVGARFSCDGDFLGYLGLEDVGIFTNHDEDVADRISQMEAAL